MPGAFHADTGSAARFFSCFPPTGEDARCAEEDADFQRQFYCAKASGTDREEGLEGFEPANGIRSNAPRASETEKTFPRRNHHPTVKPTALMRWLCRLITPPGGIVVDPFTGSGSTGKAAVLEGFRFFGVELNSDYLPIIESRLAHAAREREAQERKPVQLDLFGNAAA